MMRARGLVSDLPEAFPLSVSERQLLLQTADPLDRLSHLMQWLPRFQDA
jgi:hypothetical protein